jgi:nitric oxide dioxygenase
MTAMTPEQIALVEESWTSVAPRLDEFSAGFYRRLLAADPTLVELFGTDLATQRVRFVTELEQVIFSIRRHDAFLDRAGALGVRHKGYGVRAAHYRMAEAALLDALAEVLAERWTDEVEQAWRMAYDVTAEAMRIAAACAVRMGLPAG